MIEAPTIIPWKVDIKSTFQGILQLPYNFKPKSKITGVRATPLSKQQLPVIVTFPEVVTNRHLL